MINFFLAINIGASVLILMTAVYIPDAMRLPSFPTLLLLTTLFRLALNVSSTRLILLDADAGEIIQAFGNFVVRGELRGRRGDLPHPDADPVPGDRQGLASGWRGGRAVHARRDAGQADEPSTPTCARA